MANPINGAETLYSLWQSMTPLENSDGPADTGRLSFEKLLLDSLNQTRVMEQSAQTAIEESLSGADITQVEVFAAVKKADLALRMMLQIRNKILEAYDEIKSMQM